MKRIDMVYQKLKELAKDNGISAKDVSDALGLDRTNVSRDLNKLYEEGKIEKCKGKPVLFKIKSEDKEEQTETILDKFAKENPSLYTAAEQAKAAVLYPPKGMHILIIGETGVGKSMFANLIHKYAVETGKMEEESPFVTFNCADYANNPQLLLSQIFGAKKGTYTGADADRVGLIEKADGGILFLDEVHRLPPEGQEMFFTFIDKGTFRRLGETEAERSANVLIICATTEDPYSSLLVTFTRRIPMVIRIPGLSERTMEERFNLISRFIYEESFRLGREIKVSVNSLRAFFSYNCPNNIGQLKTDIQLACAKAYADFVSHKKNEIAISSLDLPDYIRQGLYMKTEHRKFWNKLMGINTRYCIFDSNKENILLEKFNDNVNIYEMIDLRFQELKTRGIDTDEIEKVMENEINDYFKSYIHYVNRNIDISSIENVVGHEVVEVAKEIIEYSEERLGRSLSRNIYYGIAVHISSSIERIRRGKRIINPQLKKIRTEHCEEFNIALDCLKIIERTLDVSMPIDEAAFLAMFLIYEERNSTYQRQDVKVIVIAHGNSTAASMADVANKLLGINYAIGINAPIEEKPQDVINRIKNFITEAGIKSDILFLVDMGSLTNFGKEIHEEFGIRTKTLPLVSTLHVIEATRKAMLGYSLDEVYKETLKVNTIIEDEVSNIKETSYKTIKLAIVTVCTTGEGGAVAVKNILTKNIDFDKTLVEIIPVMFTDDRNIEDKINEISKEYKIVCIVSPFRINTEILQFDLQQILSGESIKYMQKEINVESTYIKMGETLENQLKNVNGIAALNDIKEFNNYIIKSLNLKIPTNILIGVTLHVACLIDRLKSGETTASYKGKDNYIKENMEFYKAVKNAVININNKYSINISDDDICRIISFFKQ